MKRILQLHAFTCTQRCQCMNMSEGAWQFKWNAVRRVQVGEHLWEAPDGSSCLPSYWAVHPDACNAPELSAAVADIIFSRQVHHLTVRTFRKQHTNQRIRPSRPSALLAMQQVYKETSINSEQFQAYDTGHVWCEQALVVSWEEQQSKLEQRKHVQHCCCCT